MPAERTPREARMTLRSLVATGALLLAAVAGCDAPTVSDTFELTLAPDAADGRVGATWRVAELGRLAVDWRVENTGATEAQYELLAQAQTSGNRLDDACDAIAGRVVRITSTPGTSRVDTAPPEDTAPATIRDLNQAFLVNTSRDTVSWLRLRIRDDSGYRIVTSANIGLLVFPENSDTPLTPADVLRGDNTGCEGVRNAQLFDLFSGTYLIRLSQSDEGSVRLLVEEDCESIRVVARSCPGTFGATRTLAIGPLVEGTSTTGRLNYELLGVGDQVSVELRCADPVTGCVGEARLAVVNEVLECRNDETCRGGRVCSEDGYCLLNEERGCSASSPAGTALPGAAFVLLVLATLGRRRNLLRVAAPTAFVIMLLPGVAQATGPGGQVYTEVGINSLSYTGALGRLTSPGVGLELAQGLQFGTLGGRLAVGTSYYLTRQEGPPNEHLLQTLHVTVGPRVSHTISALRLLGSVDYVAAAFVTNAAASTTGPRTLAHGIGANIGARFEGALPIYAELRFGGDALLGLRVPAVRLGVTFTVGIAGAI